MRAGLQVSTGRSQSAPRAPAADPAPTDSPANRARRVGTPRLLILKLALLAVAIVASGLLISQYDVSATDDNYIAAVLEKDRIIRATPSPKLILVGGSNLAFGVDSRMLRDSLRINVVNMGLYSKLGLRYMLAQVRPYIRRGDVVVIAAEYEQFYGDFAEGDRTLNTALLYTPRDRITDFAKSYSIVDVVLRPRVENARRSFMHAMADVIGRKEDFFPPDRNPVYNRRAFNEFGDMMAHLKIKGPNPDSIYAGPIGTAKPFNRHAIKLIDEFARQARTAGAHTYFAFPSYMDRAYATNALSIDSLYREIRSGAGVPILGTPQDFVYPTGMFFDTRYHLSSNGRVLRTNRLIQLLRAAAARDRGSNSGAV